MDGTNCNAKLNLIIISGRSGSGKSTVLKALEDNDYYCIDNLPAKLIPQLLATVNNNIESLAVCIDARNHIDSIQEFLNILNSLPKNIKSQVIYLDSSTAVLIKRFSETRRKHPLSKKGISLKQAIQTEKNILEPIAAVADLTISTNQMNVHELTAFIKKRISHHHEQHDMAILFTSFGFKGGIPIDSDLVFDVRCLPNPFWQAELRAFTGLDQPVIDFLSDNNEVQAMFNDIYQYLNRWLPKFQDNNRKYLTISIGCTGGKHRSVFLSEQLCKAFSTSYSNTQILHRELLKHDKHINQDKKP